MQVKFEDFSLDIERRELWRNEVALELQPQVFDVLSYLVEHRDRVVTRDELIASVWNNRIVSDSTISSRINAVRSALGDHGDTQRLIRTLPRKGFRFLGEVKVVNSVETSLALSANDDRGPLAPKPTILVVPFRPLSDLTMHHHFTHGLCDTVISALFRLRWFGVVAGQASDANAMSSTSRSEQRFNTDYILWGSVDFSHPGVRVVAHITCARTMATLWSGRIESLGSKSFEVQDEIAVRLASAAETALMSAEGLRVGASAADRHDAWSLVVKGLIGFQRLTAEGAAQSIRLLRQAVNDYPDYAPAHSLLASTLVLSSYIGWTSPTRERGVARALADRSLDLDQIDPWSHMAQGLLAMTSLETDEAVEHFREALSLNAGFASAAGFAGLTLSLDGRSDEAFSYFETSRNLNTYDPFNSFFLAGSAVACYLEGDLGNAIEQARRAVRTRPEYTGARRILCASLARAGREKEAMEAADALRRLSPPVSFDYLRLSVPYTQRTMGSFLDGLRGAGLGD